MAIETKEMIARAVNILLLEKKVKKLTVKDIVEECGITRQTFYYHFEDIPDLLKWILDRNTDRLFETPPEQKDPESGLRYLFLLAVNARPYVEHGLRTNYRDEIEKMLEDRVFSLFMRAAEERNLYAGYSHSDLKLILRYHSQAVMGIMKGWTEADSENLDHIVRIVHQLVLGEISPRS